MTASSHSPLRSSSQPLSFAAQALHYFDRAHDTVLREPIVGRSAWRGADLVSSDEWIVRLCASDIEELEAAGRAALERGLAPGALGREQFPLAGLAPAIRDWVSELDTGRGFLVLRGLPVERWGENLSALVYWGLGAHLGAPGAQNPQGDVLGHVTDTGDDAANPFVRRYLTAADIAYHCDLADVVGLLCLRTAKRGGASRIVSSVSVYNELLARKPEWVERLFSAFALDSRDEQGKGRLPYIPVPPCRHARGRLRTFYHSDYFRSATRHAEVAPFSSDELGLLDLYEEIADSPELRLDMELEVGDVQWVSNHGILHARTAYEDHPEPERRRHLLRLWLSLHVDSAA